MSDFYRFPTILGQYCCELMNVPEQNEKLVIFDSFSSLNTFWWHLDFLI